MFDVRYSFTEGSMLCATLPNQVSASQLGGLPLQAVPQYAHARTRTQQPRRPANPLESHLTPAVPQMNAWRQIADMSDARAYGSSASLGSTVFAVGGLQSDMQVGRLCVSKGALVVSNCAHLVVQVSAWNASLQPSLLQADGGS